MRKETFMEENNNLEGAARYLMLAEKTETAIKMLADDKYYTHADDTFIQSVIDGTGVFDFSHDDIEFIRMWNNDENAQDTEKTLAYLLEEMRRCDPGERLDFYNTNVKPHIEYRDRYKVLIKSNFKNRVYYA